MSRLRHRSGYSGTPRNGGVTRVCALAVLAGLAVVAGVHGTQDAVANGDTRTIELFHVHTKERITATFRRDGSYDGETLRRLNHFLRDWRNDEQTTMSPRLFDIVWFVQREAGGAGPVHVMSAYRSPGTNEMLRRRSRAVAKESQHIQGNAMDVHIPGVSMAKAREVAMRLERGGVGYYPSAGSPFVHLDVGTVRSWPRMSRDQLERLFPDGKTVHLPRDGVPLANYQLALAEVRARGDSALDYDIITRSRGNSLWALLFGGRGDDGGEDVDAPMRASTRVATRTSPAQRGRNAPVEVAALPVGNGDDVMRPGAAQSIARPVVARPAPPVEQVLRPQPGSEPTPPAPPAAPVAPPVATPVQVAALPLPPIRPRGLGTTDLVRVNEPLPPIRPPGLQDRGQLAALAEQASLAQAAPDVALRPVSGLPMPPLRPSLIASVAAGALPDTSAQRPIAGVAASPTRPLAPAPAAVEPVAQPEPAPAPQVATVSTGATARDPGIFREALSRARRDTPRFEGSGLAQGFVATPPRRLMLAPVDLPRPPERPVAIRRSVEPAARKETTMHVVAQPEARRRPDYVVTVAEPVVEAELKRGGIASHFGAPPKPETNSFSGSFVRPMAPSFTWQSK